jgi:hypothetical protein
MLPGLSPDEQRSLILSVGTHHAKRPLTPCEVAALYQKALLNGATKEQCSLETNLGPTWISRFLSLLQLDASVRHLVNWGQTKETVSFTAAVEIARIPRGEHEPVIRAALEHQLRAKEIQQVTQIRLRSSSGILECIGQVLKLRPTKTTQFLFIGAVMQPELKMKLRERTQNERDALLRSVLDSYGTELSGCGVKLGAEKFALIASERAADFLRKQLGDFEAVINKQLSIQLDRRGQ